jgi:hypothetical protein
MSLADDLNTYLANVMAGRKICSKCGETKAVELFDRNHRGTGGRSSICKSCRRQYEIENKDRRTAAARQRAPEENARQREWYRNLSPEAKSEFRLKAAEALRAWRKRNPEKVRAYMRKDVRDVTDRYVRIALEMPKALCTPGLLALKREAIKTSRVFKQLKAAIHESNVLDDLR